jgi:hypothetical protein
MIQFEIGKTYVATTASYPGMEPYQITVNDIKRGAVYYRTGGNKWKRTPIYEYTGEDFPDGVEYLRPCGTNEKAPYIFATDYIIEKE